MKKPTSLPTIETSPYGIHWLNGLWTGLCIGTALGAALVALLLFVPRIAAALAAWLHG